MSFKQFFKEAVSLVYDRPPERAKFQLGDLVVVRDDGRWKTYQSKKTEPYINQIGEVVGYKNVPGAYTKFALKFPDGNTFLFHSHFLYGPFKDLKTAQKYTDPKVTINPADIKLKQGVNVLTDYQKRDNVETFLKDFLPKIGYTLLPQPREVISQDGKYVHTVFATMDIEYYKKMPHVEYGYTATIPGKFSCYRVNSARTKKLKSVYGGTLNAIVNRSTAHGATSGGLSYFIECPEKTNDCNMDINSLFTLTQLGIPSNPKLLDVDNIIKVFNSYKNTVQQIKAGKFNTDLDFVKLFYDINGDTITSENVLSNKVNLKNKNFYKPFKIKGNFIHELSKNTDLTSLPKEISGNLSIRNWYGSKSLKNLNGIQAVGGSIDVSNIGLKSLLGSPKIVNGDFDCGQNDLVNFEDGPEAVRGNFDFSYNEKLTSLNGLPKAKTYYYSNALLNGREVTEKDIEIALLKYKLSPTTKETFSDLIDEL